MLEWNQETSCYEATVESSHIEVDGDIFAEAEQERRNRYIREGMDKKEAIQKAWEELRDPIEWIGSLPMDGVSINGIDRSEK
jgi:hypothetical protein